MGRKEETTPPALDVPGMSLLVELCIPMCRDSSVAIANRYGLGGPRIESR